MNNSAQFKDRELRLLLLFWLIMLEMRFSAALECAAFVCFLRKLCVWEKIRSKVRARKIRFSGARKSVLLKPSSGEPCAPRNFVLFVTLQVTRVPLIVYLVVYQMK